MKEVFDEFDRAWAEFRRVMYGERWRFGVVLGGIWLVTAAVATWATWMR